MAEGRRGGANSYRVISGGGNDPLVLAGTADPTTGGGVSAPEGSIYLLNATGAGKNYWKSGAADTAWTEVPAVGSGLVSGVESNLWTPPSSPSSEDDEFTSDTISTDWNTSGATWDDTTPPSVNSNFSSGNLRYSFASRYSWVRVQPAANGSSNFLFKRYASGLPDGTYWTRLSQTVHASPSALTAGDALLGFLFGYSSGSSSFTTNTDGVWVYLNSVGSSDIKTIYGWRSSGTPTSSSLNDMQGYIPHAYIAMIRDGNSYNLFVKPEGGAWQHLGAGIVSGTINAVAFRFQNSYASGSMGNGMMDIDFFRYRSDGQLP